MKYPWAYPGRKVRCVYQLGSSPNNCVNIPKLGEVYTIRTVSNALDSTEDNDLYLRFEEILNPHLQGFNGDMNEPQFTITVFKPLTDISKLEEILHTVKLPETEDA